MKAPVLQILAMCGCLGGVCFGAGSLDKLAEDTPFLPRDQAGAALATMTDNSVLEFRGKLTTDDGVYYGIYDSASKEAMWVKQGGSGNLVVKGFDEANEALSVEYQGKVISLPMASAVIAAAKATAKPAGGGAAVPAGGGQAKQVTGGQQQQGGGENSRLQAIAAEVRARRAMRQDALPAQQQQSGSNRQQQQSQQRRQ